MFRDGEIIEDDSDGARMRVFVHPSFGMAVLWDEGFFFPDPHALDGVTGEEAQERLKVLNQSGGFFKFKPSDFSVGPKTDAIRVTFQDMSDDY